MRLERWRIVSQFDRAIERSGSKPRQALDGGQEIRERCPVEGGPAGGISQVDRVLEGVAGPRVAIKHEFVLGGRGGGHRFNQGFATNHDDAPGVDRYIRGRRVVTACRRWIMENEWDECRMVGQRKELKLPKPKPATEGLVLFRTEINERVARRSREHVRARQRWMQIGNHQ